MYLIGYIGLHSYSRSGLLVTIRHPTLLLAVRHARMKGGRGGYKQLLILGDTVVSSLANTLDRGTKQNAPNRKKAQIDETCGTKFIIISVAGLPPAYTVIGNYIFKHSSRSHYVGRLRWLPILISSADWNAALSIIFVFPSHVGREYHHVVTQ